ncbi:MAG: diacylglycerol kinase family lipid kinase [Clostridia bacterium]|nr:diacylglycerol kinase family lipid kinase [Clostridia bacterium]
MRRRALVLVNPKAGAGRAVKAWKAARPLLAEAFALEEWSSERPGHATELAERARKLAPDAVLAVGGDGTVHEVVNGLAGSDVPLAIFPFGTGNDFARALGVRPDPRQAAAVLLGGRTRRVDLGRVHGHYYVQVAGTGFDAVVAARVNASGRAGTGAVTYVRHLLATLLAYRNRPAALRPAGSAAPPAAGPILLIAVANTPYYAGGMKICPEASPEDGLLDWCRIGDLTRIEVLRALPLVFSGRHVRLPKIDTGRAPAVEVDGPPDLPVHADGEVVGHLPARFECAPKALTVFVPGG